MRQIKFRAWIDDEYMVFSDGTQSHPYDDDEIFWSILGGLEISTLNMNNAIIGGEDVQYEAFEVRGGEGDEVFFMQFTGLQDKNGADIYVGDIGEFPNGDSFIVKIESWLEIYIDWIGEPECEDQARDLYRISKATIIGTIHQNPELIK